MAQIPTALVVFFLCLPSAVFADEYDHKYATGDRVILWENKVGPYNNPQETYNYHELPFCAVSYSSSTNGRDSKGDSKPTHKWGGLGVFFSTWLFAPLGPWVNLAAGTVQLGWLRFTAWDAAGEAIWVLVYVMLGFIFAAQLPQLVGIVGEWAGLVSSGAVAGLIGSLLILNFKRLYKKSRT